MRLDPNEPAPLALHAPFCPWRKVALNELDRVGRASRIVIQATDMSGILSAVEAGLAITLLAESAFPATLKALGAAEALPTLPDFEYILQRSATASRAADQLSDMIANFYQLSRALKSEDGVDNEQSSQPLRIGL